jgi:hypothetical protein
LGIAYELEDVEAPDDEAVKAAYRYVNFKGKIPVELLLIHMQCPMFSTYEHLTDDMAEFQTSRRYQEN